MLNSCYYLDTKHVIFYRTIGVRGNDGCFCVCFMILINPLLCELGTNIACIQMVINMTASRVLLLARKALQNTSI